MMSAASPAISDPSSSLQAITNSAHSSPIFLRIRLSPLQEFVGVTPFLGSVPPSFDHTGQFGADVSGGLEGIGTPRGGLFTVVIEAAPGPGMAGHISGLFDGQQQHIGIAVVPKSHEPLGMSACGPLVPELLAGSTPVMNLTAAECAFDGIAVHPGLHQHGSIQPVLGYSGNQACVVKTEVVDELGTQGLHQTLGHADLMS